MSTELTDSGGKAQGWICDKTLSQYE